MFAPADHHLPYHFISYWVKNLNAVKTITTIPIADDPTEPSTHTTFANGPSGLILFL
jgi:hypothetical protein